jgi:hypothetical protein
MKILFGNGYRLLDIFDNMQFSARIFPFFSLEISRDVPPRKKNTLHREKAAKTATPTRREDPWGFLIPPPGERERRKGENAVEMGIEDTTPRGSGFPLREKT